MKNLIYPGRDLILTLKIIKEQSKIPSNRAVLRANKAVILKSGFLSLFCLVTRFVMPFITNELLRWFQLDDTDNSVYIYVTLLALASGLHSSILPRILEFQTTIGHGIRVQLNTLLYKKILRLSSDGTNKTSIGTMINYVANDTMFYEKGLLMFTLMCGTPFILLTTFIVLIYITGWAGVIGLAVYFIVMTLVTLMGIKMGALRSKTGQEADKRISTMEEMLNAINVVKMYCWERVFVSKLIDSRKAEIAFYKIQATLMAVSMSFAYLSAHLLVVFIYLSALFMTDYDEIFVTSTVFTVVMLSMNAQLNAKLFTQAIFYVTTIKR